MIVLNQKTMAKITITKITSLLQYKYVYTFTLGLCDNGKSDISISAIIFYRFISINNIISIMLSAKNLVLSVSSSNLN